MQKKKLTPRILLILFFLGNSLLAQETFRGKLMDYATQAPIENALIHHVESNQWTYTDDKGLFELVLPSDEQVEIEISHLTYFNKITSIEIALDNVIYLEQENLRISEIELIGKHKKHSEIVLKAEAIDNVQSFTALEVLEQLPGQATSESNINGFKNIVFRTAEVGIDSNRDESHSNKAFGTAIVVNDIPISNNENMQSWSPNASDDAFGGSFTGFAAQRDNSPNATVYNNPGLGVDLREIPTENIDEIEVVQGIPEAKYGDLTSGLVKIKTKAGVTPFISSVSFRDGTTQFNGSKGFKISDKLGFINIGASYLNSNPDPKEVLEEFNRINVNTSWSLLGNNTKNTFSLALSSTLDDGKQDPDDLSGSFVKNENRGITLSNRFSHKMKKWINEVSLNTSFSYKKQHSISRQLSSEGGEVVAVGLESGITQGLYTPVTYYAVREIEGKPLNGFMDLQLLKSFTSSKNWQHKIISGLTLRYSDNIGEGRVGNPETADNQFTLETSDASDIGYRSYSFNDNLRPEVQLAGYFQDNVIKHWSDNSFSVATGLRLDNQNAYTVLSPRLNTYFKRNNYKIRGGIGLSSKAPSLNSLYTGRQYFDFLIGDFRTENYNVAYVQTFVKEEQNLNLEPTKSLNSEIGFDYKLFDSEISVTAFYKKLWDGLTSLYVYNSIVGDDYEVANNDPNPPTINIAGETLYAYRDNNTINGLTSLDYGVEFIYKTGKIAPLNIDATVSATYVVTESNNISNIYEESTVESEDEAVGVFAESPTSIKELFRLGTSINYHIPKVGLLVNLRTEHFLIENSYAENNEEFPIGYYDKDFNYFDIPVADQSNEQLYGHLFRNIGQNDVNQTEIAHNLHLRISKDFMSGFRVDFYATNFLNLKPTFINNIGVEEERNITSLSFGMKLNYKF